MITQRSKILILTLYFFFLLLIVRLFYWQIIKSSEFKEKALLQTYKLEKILPARGKILSSDNHPLAINQANYELSIYKPNLKDNLENIIPKINQSLPDFEKDNLSLINNFKSNSNQKWISFSNQFTEEEYKKLIDIPGLSFQKNDTRFYPEDQLAKNIIRGLESFYDKQLKGKTGFIWSSKDATGKTILTKKTWKSESIDGRDLYTSINRSLQFQIEQKLKNGIENYSADSGSIIILEPKTGSVLAMASLSATSSATPSAYRNSAISDLFEPGSIFKPIVMTMAIDKKVIDESFICTGCGTPRSIGKYTITNWNSELNPNSSLRDIIKNSDNIGMSYVIDKLGLKNFLDYYKKIGLAQKTGIDLQGETKPLLKEDWPDIDLATASFGQGIAITQINMLQAFNTIANDGVLVKPHILSYFSENNKVIKPKNSTETIVFRPESTKTMKSILKYGVENGVVSKFKPQDLEVCAKSGTAEIAVKGGYSDSSTIASYIGFSPCDNPKFTMIVTINNPKTSPWGSSTAAPIWFDLASTITHLL